MRRAPRALALALLPLAAWIGLVAGQAAGQHTRSPSLGAMEIERSAVYQQADLFMQRMAHGQFQAQWSQLAPVARRHWPSAGARTAMLRRKFAGHIAAASVGDAVPAAIRPDATLVSPENPAEIRAHLWSVPVHLALRGASPRGVDRWYRTMTLYLSMASPNARPTVIGEGPASLDAPVLQPAHPSLVSTNVPILMYHRVGPYPLRQKWTDDYGYAIEYGLTVLPSQFRDEMQYLATNGYHPISLSRLANALLYGLPLPARPIVLTFDDGRQSPFYYAVPTLRRYGFTATFFVCAGFVGQTNQTAQHLNVQHYLTWPQIASLAHSGFWIEDHGQKDINPLWGLPLSTLRVEVQQSAAQLEAHTGEAVQYLAYTGAMWPYPSANESGPELQALFSQLARLGYVGAVTDSRLPGIQETTDRLWQLPRVRVSPGESLASFAASLHP